MHHSIFAHIPCATLNCDQLKICSCHQFWSLPSASRVLSILGKLDCYHSNIYIIIKDFFSIEPFPLETCSCDILNFYYIYISLKQSPLFCQLVANYIDLTFENFLLRASLFQNSSSSSFLRNFIKYLVSLFSLFLGYIMTMHLRSGMKLSNMSGDIAC